jgi:hypothetical protein
MEPVNKKRKLDVNIIEVSTRNKVNIDQNDRIYKGKRLRDQVDSEDNKKCIIIDDYNNNQINNHIKNIFMNDSHFQKGNLYLSSDNN